MLVGAAQHRAVSGGAYVVLGTCRPPAPMRAGMEVGHAQVGVVLVDVKTGQGRPGQVWEQWAQWG